MKRRPRPRAFRPTVQTLEPRVVLSNVGINLDFTNPYTQNPTWVNLANTAIPWGTYASPWVSSPSVTVNSTGYPTSPASTAIFTGNYPDGNYDLSFQGTANITFSGVGYLAGPITTDSNGVSTGVVVVSHHAGDGNTLTMQVNGLSATSPFSNFSLDAPGYGFNSTQVFTNVFLAQLQPFSSIRFLNWTETTTNGQTTWSTATPSNIFSAGNGPVPWSDIVALGNEAQKDIWINVPTNATTNYVQNLAQLIDTQLDPNLKVYVEYSNETWAGGWIGSSILQAAGSNPLISPSASNSRRLRNKALTRLSLTARSSMPRLVRRVTG